jgi:hypothetical protein
MTAGPRCSELCPSTADYWTSHCKSTKSTSSVQTNANTSPIVAVSTHRCVRDDSWPTVFGIEPVSSKPGKRLQNRRNIRPQQNHTSNLTQQSRCSQNISDDSQDCQSTVQSPQSAGTQKEDNLKKEKNYFLLFFFSFSVTVATPRAS